MGGRVGQWTGAIDHVRQGYWRCSAAVGGEPDRMQRRVYQAGAIASIYIRLTATALPATADDCPMSMEFTRIQLHGLDSQEAHRLLG